MDGNGELIMDMIIDMSGTKIPCPCGDHPANAWNDAETLYAPPVATAAAVLVVADLLEGPWLYEADGTPVPRSQAEFVAIAEGSSILFFCPEKGLYHYDEILTGQELVDALEYCPGTIKYMLNDEGGNVLDDNDVPIYVRN